MIFTSLNLRGLGGSSKITTLRRIFALIHLDVVFIQETMSEAWKACQFFLNIFLGWEVSAIDATGRSIGLLCI